MLLLMDPELQSVYPMLKDRNTGVFQCTEETRSPRSKNFTPITATMCPDNTSSVFVYVYFGNFCSFKT